MLVAASLGLETRLVTEVTVYIPTRPDLELAYAVRPSEGRGYRPVKYTIIIPLHH